MFSFKYHYENLLANFSKIVGTIGELKCSDYE